LPIFSANAELFALNNMDDTNARILDPGELAKVVGNDLSELKEFTQNYRDVLVEHSEKILQGVKDGNWDATANLAHRLKSSSRAMGAFDLADCCESIEHHGKSGSASLPEGQANEFGRLVRLVLEAIDTYLLS